MNGSEVLRIVDAIHRDKNIDKDIVFEGIEQAILSAARKHYGEESDLDVDIDRDSGEPTVRLDGETLSPDVLGDLLGRIAAQTAKQVMIQKIREAERDALYDEYSQMKGQIVTGTITRVEGGACTVNMGKVEGILPRGEQIPGESHRMNERVRATILDVRKVGTRVKIILSRTHPDFVRRLFELEVPEVSEHIIEVRSLAREAGYRSKVAVSCIDSKIDSVGACVGVRGSRIKNIVNELAGERIDIVRWNDSLQVLVPNALQPAEVEDVILCQMLGRVLVLVRDDQLPLAIGKMGQNVRLASKLVGWDIEVMTREELDEQLDKSVEAFSAIPGVSEELAESLVAQGFFSYYDLSCIEPDQLAELGGLTPEECDTIIAAADEESDRQEEDEARRRAEEMAAKRAQRAEEAARIEAEAASPPAGSPAEAAETQPAETQTGTAMDAAELDTAEIETVPAEAAAEPVAGEEAVAEEEPVAGEEPGIGEEAGVGETAASETAAGDSSTARPVQTESPEIESSEIDPSAEDESRAAASEAEPAHAGGDAAASDGESADRADEQSGGDRQTVADVNEGNGDDDKSLSRARASTAEE